MRYATKPKPSFLFSNLISHKSSESSNERNISSTMRRDRCNKVPHPFSSSIVDKPLVKSFHSFPFARLFNYQTRRKNMVSSTKDPHTFISMDITTINPIPSQKNKTPPDPDAQPSQAFKLPSHFPLNIPLRPLHALPPLPSLPVGTRLFRLVARYTSLKFITTPKNRISTSG